MSSQELQVGITWRSLLAILLVAAAFMPITIFTNLLFGSGIGVISVAFVTLIFTELVRYSVKPLSRQEVLIVYFGATICVGMLSGGSSYFQILIYRSYFVNSPFGWSANVNEVPLALLVPEWMAPSYGSAAHAYRSLYQPAYMPALAVYTVKLALATIAEIALAMLIARISLQVEEEFPFPFAQVDNTMVTFISERPPDLTRIFLISMFPGIVYALIVYVGPVLLNVMLIPIPYIDLTIYLRDYIPGAAIGIATSIFGFVGGMMIPFITSAYILAGSVIIWIVLNSLFITTFTDLFPRWSSEFYRGMGLATIQQRSSVTVWFAPQIGFGLAVSLYMIYKFRKVIVTVFRGTFKGKSLTPLDVQSGFPNASKLLVLYLLSTSASVALHNYLIPTIPIWVPLLASIGYSFLLALILTAEQGVVGYTVAPSFTWQALVYTSPYQGYAGFAFDPAIVGTVAPSFTQQVKVALLNKTKPMELVKIRIIATVLSTIIGLIALNFFWSIAPMPSAAYPSTLYSWPYMAQIDVFTATRQLEFTPQSLLIPAVILLALCFAGDIALKFGLPFSLIGLFFGLFWQPTSAIPFFVGSAISRFVMAKYFKDKWNIIRAPVVAGISLGEGLVLMFLTSVKLIASSSWMWPW